MMQFADMTSVGVVTLSTILLTEIAKRWKAFPVDPNNKNAVKLTSFVVALALSCLLAWLRGTLSLVDVQTFVSVAFENALLSFAGAHIGYNALPYLKEKKDVAE